MRSRARAAVMLDIHHAASLVLLCVACVLQTASGGGAKQPRASAGKQPNKPPGKGAGSSGQSPAGTGGGNGKGGNGTGKGAGGVNGNGGPGIGHDAPGPGIPPPWRPPPRPPPWRPSCPHEELQVWTLCLTERRWQVLPPPLLISPPQAGLFSDVASRPYWRALICHCVSIDAAPVSALKQHS